MKENERSLQKIREMKFNLPVGFESLTDEDKITVIKRLQDQDLELRKEFISKVTKSQIAEHDLSVLQDTIEQLDSDKKIYSIKQSVETGSGKVSVDIKGGDTRFIIPIIISIGLLIIGVISIFIFR